MIRRENLLELGKRLVLLRKNVVTSKSRFVSVNQNLLLLTEKLLSQSKIVTSKKKFGIFGRKLASSN